MTFGTEVVIPVEIRMTTFQKNMYDYNQNDEQLCHNLDLIYEVRKKSQIRMKEY